MLWCCRLARWWGSARSRRLLLVRSRFLRGTRSRSRVCGQGVDVCCLLLGAGGGLVARGLLVEGNGKEKWDVPFYAGGEACGCSLR
jgi:hypothetical protein